MKTKIFLHSIATTLAVVGICLQTASAAGPRPLFQMPVPCGQKWDLSTYNGHWPDQDSIDMTERGANLSNTGEGQPVLAAHAGTVHQVFTTNNGEHRVYLNHGGGWMTHYIHLESLPPLTVGQKVGPGEQIGRTGKSGTAAVHLHFTQLQDGSAVRSQFNEILAQTHAGNLASYGTWGTANAERLMSVNCAGESFMGYTYAGGNYNFLYRPQNGQATILRMNDTGTSLINKWNSTWSKGWTHFVPYPMSTQWHSLVYKSATGTVSFLRMNLDGGGVTTLNTIAWGKGWTHFVPFRKSGVTYVLAYNSLYGWANLERVHNDGSGTTNLFKQSWVKGRTVLAPFEMGPDHYVLLYRASDGVTKVSKVSGTGNNVSFIDAWSGVLTTNWTHVVPFSHEGARYFLLYQAHTGLANIARVNPNGQGLTTVKSMSWAKTWTHFTPSLINGKTHILAYRTSTGLAKILKVNPAGDGITELSNTTWTTGWN